jgi:hypothetical protein
VSESRHRYLYERLGDHGFQQLVSALLANQFPDYLPMALRQTDGGIDGRRNIDPKTLLIYQVKWSANGMEKHPVSWLDAVVKKELNNLRRLAKEGVRNYVLVTNVASTAKPETGTFAQLDKKLGEYAKDLGYERITCVWREALNPWVDNAPDSTKWAYADMLAGWDLIRYLVAEQVGATKNQADRNLIRKVAAAQWDDDQRVKFSQADVDRERVVDLFVDVTADQVHSPTSTLLQSRAAISLWALTSKVDGTYEFEVLSLREYFAARFLYRNAGEENADFDSTTVLQELLRRPYWLNTARFYGGNAKGSDVYTLTAGIEQELAQTSAPASYLAAWALLTDGVFLRRPREARKVLTAVCSDAGTTILLSALDRRDIIALPELPDLPADDGADPTWLRLTATISKNPSDSANPQRVRVLRELFNQRSEFATWWYQHLTGAIGTGQQKAWLALGACCEAGAGITASFDNMHLSDGAAELFLSTGLAPEPGSSFEVALLTAVLDGECPCVTSTRSMPAQVAVALTPGEFLTNSETGFMSGDDRAKRRRSEAINQLRKARSPWEQIGKKRAFKSGQKGSTFPWANTAAAVHEHAGRCWIASEIAIIGAASPFKLAYRKNTEATAFGTTSHPSVLLAQTSTNSRKSDWWREQLEAIDDDLGRAEWALALWTTASGAVVSELLPELTEVLGQLPATRRRTVLRAAEQIARFGWLEKRPVTAATSDAELAALNRLRAPTPPTAPRQERKFGWGDQTTLPALLTVARAERWLKVDTAATYR